MDRAQKAAWLKAVLQSMVEVRADPYKYRIPPEERDPELLRGLDIQLSRDGGSVIASILLDEEDAWLDSDVKLQVRHRGDSLSVTAHATVAWRQRTVNVLNEIALQAGAAP